MNIEHRNVELVMLDYSAALGIVQIELRDGPGELAMHIQCQHLLHVCLATTYDAGRAPFTVNVTMRRHTGVALEVVLERLGYPWTSYPSPEQIFHLHAEGEIVLDVVATTEFIVLS